MLERLKTQVLHFLFPLTCHHCAEDLAEGDPGPLCPACQAEVRFVLGAVCAACGAPLEDGAPCLSCLRASPGLPIRAAVLYGAQVRSLVRAFKYDCRKELAHPLGG